MKKYKLETILFIVNAIYMILELIASRILAPYFGNTNLVWTSIIGIILLSTSVGNYIGGNIADKKKESNEMLEKHINIILIVTAILIFIIPVTQEILLTIITYCIKSVKIGAIIATLLLFFLPSMFIGMLSPIIIKLKINELENVGKTSGKIYALATLGSIVGTFLGGFFLIPQFGSNQILFVLSIITLILIFLMYNRENKAYKKLLILVTNLIIINILLFCTFTRVNATKEELVLEGQTDVKVNYDTQYGKVTIYNLETESGRSRHLNIDKGNESGACIDKGKENELIYKYTAYYDLMFKSSKQIKDVLMIGGAGYSYPKYYISHYPEKTMDVVEIDGEITEIAKKYFFLDKLIKDFNLENNKRLNFITEDGRIYLNKNTKKYDAILNDSFSGITPARILTTKEAIQKIRNSLKENGVYLTNIISSAEGENSRFLKAEVNTLKQQFKNVYVIPCNDRNDKERIQNNMVVATDDEINFPDSIEINLDNAIILTDNFCPTETIIPEMFK